MDFACPHSDICHTVTEQNALQTCSESVLILQHHPRSDSCHTRDRSRMRYRLVVTNESVLILQDHPRSDRCHTRDRSRMHYRLVVTVVCTRIVESSTQLQLSLCDRSSMHYRLVVSLYSYCSIIHPVTVVALFSCSSLPSSICTSSCETLRNSI